MRSNHFLSELQRRSPDIFGYLCSWLNLQGPSVHLIEGEPSEEQKAAVIATALTGNKNTNGEPERDEQRPDLRVYHVLTEYSHETKAWMYRIGFCRRTPKGFLEYAVAPLDSKSPLLRYLREDLQDGQYALALSEYSRLFPYNRAQKTRQCISEDRILIKYLEKEIQAADGLVRPPLKNRQQLASVSKGMWAAMNVGRGFFKPADELVYRRPVFPESVKQKMLEDVLHHTAYGEVKKVMKRIKMDITLLQSGHKAAVTLCSPEIFCPEICFFDLVVFLGDWFLWRDIVKAINDSDLPEKEKQYYKDNFLARIETVERFGIKVKFNNLLNKGVQILDADVLNANPKERKRYEDDVVNRNSYHLIIQTLRENEKRSVILCELGYRNPETGSYEKIAIPPDHELFKVVALELFEYLKSPNNKAYGVQHVHYFTRSNRDLELVREILEKVGIETCFDETLKIPDYKLALEYLDEGIDGYQNHHWSDDRLREQWHGEICPDLLRQASPWLLALWSSAKNPWSLYEREVSNFINSPVERKGLKNFDGESIFPFPGSMGDKFSPMPGRSGLGGPSQVDVRLAVARLLKSILKAEEQERKNLKACLQADVTLTSIRRVAP